VAALDHAIDGVRPLKEPMGPYLGPKVLVEPLGGRGRWAGRLDVRSPALKGRLLAVVPRDEGTDVRLIGVVHAHQLLGSVLKSAIKIRWVREGHDHRLC
jgi:hypothetical protein